MFYTEQKGEVDGNSWRRIFNVAGWLAGPDDDVGRLFAWMFQGSTDLTVSTGSQDIDLKLSSESAESFEEMIH